MQISLHEINAIARRDVPLLDILNQLIAQGKVAPFVCDAPPAVYVGYESEIATACALVVARVKEQVTIAGPSKSGITSSLHVLAHRLRDIGTFKGGIFVVNLEGALADDTGLSAVCERVQARLSGGALAADFNRAQARSKGGVLAASLKAWCYSRQDPVVVLVDCGHQPALRWWDVLAPCTSEKCENDAVTFADNVTWVLGSSGDDAVATVTGPLASGCDVVLPGFNGADREEQCKDVINFIAPVLAGYVRTIGERCQYMPGRVAQFCSLDVTTALSFLQLPSTTSAGGAGGSAVNITEGSVVVSSLSESDRAALSALLVFPGMFNEDAGAAVLGWDVNAAIELLERFDSIGVCKRTDGRWSVVKLQIEGLAAADAAVLARFARYVANKLRSVNELFGSTVKLTGLALFDSERDTIERAFDLLCGWAEQPEEVQRELVRLQCKYRMLASRLADARLDTLSSACLALSRACGNHDEQSTALLFRGGVLGVSEKFADALRLCREAEGIRRGKHTEPHEDVAEAMFSIGAVLFEENNFPEALSAYQESLAIRKAVAPEPQPAAVAESMYSIATVLACQGNLREALDICVEMQGVVRDVSACDSVLHIVETLVTRKQLYDGAVQLYDLCVSELNPVYGPDHVFVAEFLYALSVEQDKPDNKLRVHRETLRVNIAAYGERHTAVAVTLNNIGYVLQKQRKFAEACDSFSSCLAMRRTLPNCPRSDLARSLSNVAGCLRELGRLPEALELFKESLAISTAIDGPNHARTKKALKDTNDVEARLAASASASASAGVTVPVTA